MNVQIAKVVGVVTLMLGILGALIGCIALKADSTITLGLATAFGAAATAVVQWLTKSNGEKTPPGGPLAVLLVAAASAVASPGCADPVALPAASAAEAAYREEQRACVRQYDTRELIEACRAKVREHWGVVDAPDGGAQ